MRKFFYLFVMLVALTACGSHSESTALPSRPDPSEWTSEDSLRYSAQDYADKVLHEADWEGAVVITSMEKTMVENRYKAIGTVNNVDFEMYLQKFDDGWHHGNVKVFGEVIADGDMKEMEQQEINTPSEIQVNGKSYRVLAKNPGHFMMVYSSKKLSKKEMAAIFDQYAADYGNLIHFTTNPDPSARDYYESVMEWNRKNL